jgi:hypothetical protein
MKRIRCEWWAIAMPMCVHSRLVKRVNATTVRIHTLTRAGYTLDTHDSRCDREGRRDRPHTCRTGDGRVGAAHAKHTAGTCHALPRRRIRIRAGRTGRDALGLIRRRHQPRCTRHTRHQARRRTHRTNRARDGCTHSNRGTKRTARWCKHRSRDANGKLSNGATSKKHICTQSIRDMTNTHANADERKDNAYPAGHWNAVALGEAAGQ